MRIITSRLNVIQVCRKVQNILNKCQAVARLTKVFDVRASQCNAIASNVIPRGGSDASVLSSSPEECFPSPRRFTVLLKKPLEANEHMGLTGDTFELGAWDPMRSVQLTATSPNAWSAVVSLCSPGKVQYRYFVYTLDCQGRIQIKRWESFVEPRNMRTCTHGCMRLDKFGESDEQKQISRGWLTNETVVQLKLFNEVFAFEGTSPEEFFVKLVPLQNETDLPNYGENADNVDVVNMKYRQSVLKRQTGLGVLYKSGDAVVFQLAVPLGSENSSYALVLHSADSQPLGHGVISLESVMDSDEKLNVTITSPDAGKGIACAKIASLVVRPLSGVKQTFRTSYAYTWKPEWQKLLVGHRGDGISFSVNGAPITENTIASYKKAFESNADMIELDVHITQDLVPVIYHDYKFLTARRGVQPRNRSDLEQVYLKDLRYSQIQDMPVYRVIGDEIRVFPSHNAENRTDHRLFPTLEEVFLALPLGLGINVEIKWPQAHRDGTLEADQVQDKNLFVDMILMTTLRYGCGRMLIFSSFDADICSMVRFKQNMLPVMFLTQGSTTKWPAYDDPRCNSVEAAVNHAQATELNGIAPYSEDILKQPELISLATDLGQKVFLWGDDINSLERVRFFEEAGVTANIFDRVDLIIPADKPGSVFDNNETLEYFRGECPL